MAKTFERSNEWGGFTVESAETGFVVEYHAHIEGEIDDVEILVPYGTWGFHRSTDLEAPHDAISANGEVLAEMAAEDAKLKAADRKVQVLDKGVVFSQAARKDAVPEPSPSSLPGGVKSGTSWYTFSVRKDDDVSYGKAHDLFTTMLWTHGAPYGMTLWVKSSHAAEETIFFAQIPQMGLDLASEPFFRAFPVTECASPSRVALSLLIGKPERRAVGERLGVAARKRSWWRSATSALHSRTAA